MTPLKEHADYPELAVAITDLLAVLRQDGEFGIERADVADLRAQAVDVDRCWVEYSEDASIAMLLGRLHNDRWLFLAVAYDEDDDPSSVRGCVRASREELLGAMGQTDKLLLGIAGPV